MEKERLVTRNKDLGRKNLVRIALTKKGSSIPLTLRRLGVIRNMLNCLSRDERKQFNTFLNTLLRKATRKFAIINKTKPVYELYQSAELDNDFWRILGRTSDILSNVYEALKNTNKSGLTTGIEALDKNDIVRTALTEKCFSPEELEQLSEYLEILRSQTTSKSKTTLEAPQAQSTSDGDLEHDIWRTFRRAYDIILRIRDKELSKFGLSVKSASVLLWTKTLGDKATPLEIAKHRLRSPQAIYTSVLRLEKGGLMKKIQVPRQKNQSRLILTKKGEKFLEWSAQSESVYQIFNCLSAEELGQFSRYLESIYEKASGIYSAS